jgi:hypothetical protein
MNENGPDTPPLPGGWISAHEKRPLPGQRVMVMCFGCRCLGYLDVQGAWRDDARDQELKGVVAWQKLIEGGTTDSVTSQ